ncbi:MAG: hypothetical protein HYY84_13040 [Deltaproteobacteria bacterium]|nr:hypothetical protein [Deltaproteobacteria bacterium]
MNRLALALLVPACGVWQAESQKAPQQHSSSLQERATPSSTRRYAAAPGTESDAKRTAAVTIAPSDCPVDMAADIESRSIDTRKAPPAERSVDTRRGRPKTLKAPKRVAWVRGHRKPVAPSFALEPSKAVDQALDIEKTNMTNIPAGFRSRVAASPRDASLRLELARCELRTPATRRRASYDAAVALLLGAPREQVEPVLLEATENESNTNNSFRSCDGASSCPSGMACDRGYCLNAFGSAVSFISKADLAIEDTLSRALWKVARDTDRTASRRKTGADWWLLRRLHKCGKHVCSFEEYAAREGTALVRWDRRDGGEVVTIKRNLTPGEKAILAAKTRCWERTGWQTRGSCLQMCEVRMQGAGCRTSCYAHCSL